MQYPWISSYPKHVPAEIDPSLYDSLRTLFEQSVRQFRHKPACTNFNVTLTYDDLDRQSRDLAAYFQQVCGLRKGDRVALMMPNALQYPVALLACFKAGFVVVNINPLYTPRELHHQLADSGATAIIVFENFADKVAEVLAETPLQHVIVTAIGDCFPWLKGTLANFICRRIKKLVPPFSLPKAIRWREALDQGRTRSLQTVVIHPEDLAFLQYTGGTTGPAKGAMLTHRNILANLLQAQAWIAQKVVDGEERVMTALPMYHIFSLTINVLLFLRHGGHLLLITNPKELNQVLDACKRYSPTIFTGVNTLFNALLNQPSFVELSFKSLKLTLGGGAAVQSAVAKRWLQVTGSRLVEAYGLTECSPGVCVNPLDEDVSGSIGLPLPSTRVVLKDDEGKEVAIGQPGELCVQGPQVMRGYWNQPKETEAILDRQGMLRTGDIATMDERGFFRITDRKKDMILVSGFNVYPNEVEAVVAEHPLVKECAVVGVPDERTGEAVALFVVPKPDAGPDFTADQLKQFCKTQLTAYKIPSRYYFETELPKTAVGKILRKDLRQKLLG